MEDSESRDSSCYFPRCKKDANCKCEMCLASINATLDLMPRSIQKSSVTKLSLTPPRRGVETTPLVFDSSVISTPRSDSRSVTKPPAPKPIPRKEVENDEKDKVPVSTRSDLAVLKVGLILAMVFGAELGFRFMVNSVLGPQFANEKVKYVAEKASAVRDLNGRLRFLQEQLKGVVTNGKISNCSHNDSLWKINQDGSLLISRCILYKSATEEVGLWGWPLQTAGLLKLGFSSSSITVLTGGVTQWANGRIGFSIRKSNSSWVQPPWSASVVQLYPNTWVLEYRRSSFVDRSSLIAASLELLRHRISCAARAMNEELHISPAFWNFYSQFSPSNQMLVPT